MHTLESSMATAVTEVRTRLAIIATRGSLLAGHLNRKRISCASCAAVNPNNCHRKTTRLNPRKSPKTSASVTFGKITLLWFPSPTVLVENAKVSFDDRNLGSIQTRKIYSSQPDVTYLSPADVGTELLSLPMRILDTPLDAIRLFVPSGEFRDKNITQ